MGPGTLVDSAALDALSAIPSIQLFVDRAQQVQPSFRLTPENAHAVAEICARLDGLPLGIELAAARVALLGARGVAERLARQVDLPAMPAPDAPARQRTLEQAIAWSHDLLDPAARKLFARLSIFSGGWRLDEAEAICGPAAEVGGEVIELLAELVDQNLIVTREDADGDVRYEMLETIRTFAADQLAATGDSTELGRRHARAAASRRTEAPERGSPSGPAWNVELAETLKPKVHRSQSGRAPRWSVRPEAEGVPTLGGIIAVRAPVAQWIERRPPEPKVAGSNPVGRAIATFSGSASANPWAYADGVSLTDTMLLPATMIRS